MQLWNCAALSLLLAMVLCQPGSQQSTLGLASAGGSMLHTSRGIVSVAGGWEGKERDVLPGLRGGCELALDGSSQLAALPASKFESLEARFLSFF